MSPLAAAALAALLSPGAPPRPHILGISHVGLRVSSVPAARAFYEDFLGLRGLRVGARQHVELVQPAPGVRPAPEASGAPVSRHILHLGIIVGDVTAAVRFYGGVLGFSETWRGSRSGTELSWINVKVPDGGDYVEFMLYGEKPAPDARGTQHHVCLEVADLAKAQALLEALPYRVTYPRPLEPRVGTNRKRQLNLYDPDGTRVELMEPGTVDGQPAPSSTAPPPRHP